MLEVKKLLSVPDYARYRGCSYQVVQDAMISGKISFTKDPKGKKLIDPKLADKEWAKNSDPSQHSTKPHKGIIAEPIAKPKKKGSASYAESRALREGYNAELARLLMEERQGQLIEAEKVKEEAFVLARTVRDSILAIPDRLSAELCSITDNNEMHSRLTKELVQALENLSGPLAEV